MADQSNRGNAGSSNSSNSNRSGHVDQNDSSQENRTDKLGKDRVIGRGMSSPDSTEAVLDASTGEPDPRARGEGSLTSGSSGKSGSSSTSNSSSSQGGSRTAEQESHLSAGKSGGNKNSHS